MEDVHLPSKAFQTRETYEMKVKQFIKGCCVEQSMNNETRLTAKRLFYARGGEV